MNSFSAAPTITLAAPPARTGALDPSAYVDRWGLAVDGEGFSTHSSDLLPVRHGGIAGMLKVARTDEERRGNHLMARWAGRGAARVLLHDDAAIVLERATGPRSLTVQATDAAGSPHWTHTDARATRTLCAVARELHAVDDGLPSTSSPTGPRGAGPAAELVPLERWFRALLPRAETHRGFSRRAATTARALLDERRDLVVLHGDLHHGNVLDFGDAAEQHWKAIDPKGLVGDRAFDYANMLCNPSYGLALLPGRLERQVAVVSAAADLGTDRLLRWLVAWCGLSAAWFHEADPRWVSAATGEASEAGVLAIGRAAEALLR